MASIELNGTKFEYLERGKGEPLLLVHGSNGDLRTWHAQLEPLSRRFRVIAYSRRYHWPNPAIGDGSDYSMPEHVEDLKALIGALELSPVHLVGHSYGGFVCLLLAISSPACVKRLVLTEAPVLPLVVPVPPKSGDVLELFMTRPLTAIGVMKLVAGGILPAIAQTKRGNREEALRLMGRAILGRKAFEQLGPERLEQARANFIDQELLGSLFPPLSADQVRGVRCPVLLVHGDQSPRLFRHLNRTLERLLPHVEQVEIAGASHLVHEDQPRAYAAAVEAFLTSAASRPSGAVRVGNRAPLRDGATRG